MSQEQAYIYESTSSPVPEYNQISWYNSWSYTQLKTTC